MIKLRALVLTLLCVLAVSAAAAPPASAKRLAVWCGSTYVWSGHPYVPNNWVVGALYAGQTFDVMSGTNQGYAWGFAYGHVNRYGWVETRCLNPFS
ncbi:hypothetical protein LRS13_22765 [Svornostia abyssi]|uniref:Uncharacterized protein n=1 Tax=Svornostia abyssi TaxID=2898438 RepID=A0ABY5PFK3_9ACTN|nr:hypothetical protein LRS13_22765 [Parviterribacteraceae bacterium J379]